MLLWLSNVSRTPTGAGAQCGCRRARHGQAPTEGAEATRRTWMCTSCWYREGKRTWGKKVETSDALRQLRPTKTAPGSGR